MLDRLVDTALEAGELALSMQSTINVELKNDQSVVTSADLAVSKLVSEKLEDLWSQSNWKLIDEEQPDKFSNPKEVLNQEEHYYIIAVDPIDGTRPYANSLPWWGVSIGIIKNGQPYMGVVNFPAMGELFFGNENSAWHLKSDGTKELIIPRIVEPGSRSIFFGSEGFTNTRRWRSKHAHMVIAGSAVVNLCFPAAGRGIGSVFKAHVWDFAGSWPVLKAAGLELHNVAKGKELNKISEGIFSGGKKHPWLLNDPHICCHSSNLKVLIESVSSS